MTGRRTTRVLPQLGQRDSVALLAATTLEPDDDIATSIGGLPSRVIPYPLPCAVWPIRQSSSARRGRCQDRNAEATPAGEVRSVDRVERAVQGAIDAAAFDIDAPDVDGVSTKVRFEPGSPKRGGGVTEPHAPECRSSPPSSRRWTGACARQVRRFGRAQGGALRTWPCASPSASRVYATGATSSNSTAPSRSPKTPNCTPRTTSRRFCVRGCSVLVGRAGHTAAGGGTDLQAR